MAKLSTKAPGEIVKLNVDGSPRNFVVASQNYEPDYNLTPNTAVIGIFSAGTCSWSESGVAVNWENSGVYALLQSFIDRLDDDIKKNIITAKYEIDSNLGSGVKISSSKIFTVSPKEMGASKASGSNVPDIPNLGTTFNNISTISNHFFPILASYTDDGYTRIIYNNEKAYRFRASGFSKKEMSAAGTKVANVYQAYPMFLLPNNLDVENDGTIIANSPPTTPASISFEIPKAGKSLQITCGASTDPDSDPITYVFERQIDSGGWMQIASGSATTVTDTVPSSGTNYNVRVKAKDSNGNESDYRTGTAKAIVYNQPPSVPASIAFGDPHAGKPLQITCAASTDPDGNPITHIWERQIDSGGWTQIGSGASTSITDTVPSSGSNYNVRVKARDSEGAESEYRTGSGKAIIYNQPPTTPGVPQYKYPIPGDEMPVKWQASTDPENGTVTYVVETKAGSEEWVQAGETVDTSYQVNVPKVSSVGVMFAVRVKAKDIEGAESAHATGAETEILYHKVVRKIPWSKGTPFKARQFTRNDKKQYQTMLEGALVEVTQ